jgi:hypothetical protein
MTGASGRDVDRSTHTVKPSRTNRLKVTIRLAISTACPCIVDLLFSEMRGTAILSPEAF